MADKWATSWICDRADTFAFNLPARATEMHAECSGIGFVANSGKRWRCSCWCHKGEGA